MPRKPTNMAMPAPDQIRPETDEEAAERKAAFRKANGIEKTPGGGFGAGLANDAKAFKQDDDAQGEKEE